MPAYLMKNSNIENDDVHLSRSGLLGMLANCLDCKVDDFYTGAIPANVEQLAEVVRLWGQLPCDDDRERVLRLMRERARVLNTN